MLAFPKFVHWAARSVALLVAILFLVLLVGEIVTPHSSRPPAGFEEWFGIALLLLVITGMLLASKWELPGALLSLGALIAWVLLVRISRYPDIVVLLAAPSVLFLGDWALHFGLRHDRNP